jgi:hypothetical protein
MFNIFNALFGFSDVKLFRLLGRAAYIRNGVGYGGISDAELFDNKFIQIGFGYIVSGHGDWGGGFDRASDYALKVTIDKNFIIKKVGVSSFYNSPNEYKKIERIAYKIAEKLKVGDRFIVKDPTLKPHLLTIFPVLGVLVHCGYDVFKHSHMLRFFVEESWQLIELNNMMRREL